MFISRLSIYESYFVLQVSNAFLFPLKLKFLEQLKVHSKIESEVQKFPMSPLPLLQQLLFNELFIWGYFIEDRFTEKLERQCKEFLYIHYLVFPINNILYHPTTLFEMKKPIN